VTDAADGQPISGAHVADSWLRPRIAKTGVDGRYEIHGLPPTAHRTRARLRRLVGACTHPASSTSRSRKATP
jgi:hypothetical protein